MVAGVAAGQAGMPGAPKLLAGTGQATGNVEADVLVFRDLDPGSLPMFTADRGSMQFEVIPLTGDLELVHSLSLALPAVLCPRNCVSPTMLALAALLRPSKMVWPPSLLLMVAEPALLSSRQ